MCKYFRGSDEKQNIKKKISYFDIFIINPHSAYDDLLETQR